MNFIPNNVKFSWVQSNFKKSKKFCYTRQEQSFMSIRFKFCEDPCSIKEDMAQKERSPPLQNASNS